MRHDTCRFFIELHMKEENVPRNRETEMRRAQASAFIEQFALWLREREMSQDVSMAVTALGQVQLTCAPDLIDRLNTHETLPAIAAIRRGSTLSDSIQRVGGR